MKSSRVGHVLDPQVSGALGDATVFESRDGLPRVSKVEYVLDAPDADDLILSFRVFLVSLELGQVLSRAAPGLLHGQVTPTRGADQHR